LQASLQARPGGIDEWKAIVDTPLVRQLTADLEKMRAIGHACCSDDQDWFNIYKNATENQSMAACLDPNNPYALQYRLEMVLPVKLANALAITSEIELTSHWNSFLVSDPTVVSRTKGTSMTVRAQTSAMMGLIKNESLDEIHRYIDEEAGIVAEHMCSVQEGNPLYSKPSRGFKRTQTKIESLWVACGPHHTLLRQTGTLELPFKLTKYLLQSLTGLVAKYILSGLIKTSNRSLEPGNPWEEAMAKDANDFYRRLDRCSQSEASQRRRPISGRVSCDASELSSFLNRHQLPQA